VTFTVNGSLTVAPSVGAVIESESPPAADTLDPLEHAAANRLSEKTAAKTLRMLKRRRIASSFLDPYQR
jgi:hypothetical protein